MKYLIVLVVISILSSCKTQTNKSLVSNASSSQFWCPENGLCSFEILSNKDLRLKNDEFGKTYLELEDSNKTVLKFQYEKTNSSNIIDGSYKEEVFIAIDPDNIELETQSFKRIQVVFGRWCYCKGQVGNFRVRSGRLSIKRVIDNTYKIELNFKVNEVPQVLTQIVHQFNLP